MKILKNLYNQRGLTPNEYLTKKSPLPLISKLIIFIALFLGSVYFFYGSFEKGKASFSFLVAVLLVLATFYLSTIANYINLSSQQCSQALDKKKKRFKLQAEILSGIALISYVGIFYNIGYSFDENNYYATEKPRHAFSTFIKNKCTEKHLTDSSNAKTDCKNLNETLTTILKKENNVSKEDLDALQHQLKTTSVNLSDQDSTQLNKLFEEMKNSYSLKINSPMIFLLPQLSPILVLWLLTLSLSRKISVALVEYFGDTLLNKKYIQFLPDFLRNLDK
ncbi:hypothetical protein K4H28_15200 [Deefgea tanakiae]|uniref:Uncharacterized protein n=1 Tax=Deefgea tanakiae TaxID=2865840 RepID=A0ABX8Z4U0_9NEIS|nr:hypothetical protein [Deefgea tanakiae]QZA77602.1 hypothetical protein K4H28_15200 [Deefgea tanakiae]